METFLRISIWSSLCRVRQLRTDFSVDRMGRSMETDRPWFTPKRGLCRKDFALKFRPRVKIDFCESSRELNWEMRLIKIDWQMQNFFFRMSHFCSPEGESPVRPFSLFISLRTQSQFFCEIEIWRRLAIFKHLSPSVKNRDRHNCREPNRGKIF